MTDLELQNQDRQRHWQPGWCNWKIGAIAHPKSFLLPLAQMSVRLAFVFALTLIWLSSASSAVAAPNDQPKTCRIGSYITSLHDLNPADRSFGAEFWLWSVCPSKELQPLKRMEVVNATSTEISNESELERQDKIGAFRQQGEVYWFQQKVKATLRHDWDIQNYPFDRHVLEIPIEETVYDTTNFVYTPDTANSTYKQDMHLDGWQITNFQVKQSGTTYKSTFGDPELSSGESTYTRLALVVSVQRQSVFSFLKVASGVYAAFLICLLSFFLKITEVTSRISMLSGSLFAALVNMRGVEAVLGRTEQVTLLDKIHILTLAYVVIAGLATIVSGKLADSESSKAVILFNRRLCLVFSLSFVITNAILIFTAVKMG
ncbi:MAG TPA: hypothetical protein V6C84_07620 [Coleofasciculaceae cyanobacterium]|jgi:hypothetical protein